MTVSFDVKAAFSEELEKIGMFAGYCRVGAYNEHPRLQSRERLHIRNPKTGDYYPTDRMMAVVANSRHVWPHFLQWAAARLETLSTISDPFDVFSREKIQAAVEAVEKRYAEHLLQSNNDEAASSSPLTLLVRFDTDKSPFIVIMQAAGHVAGVANYEPSLVWSVHPEFGMWIGYRGVVLFDLPTDECHDPPPLLTEEQRALILDMAEENLANVEGGGIYDQLNLVQQRLVVCVSEEKKYPNEMIRWFHAANPQGRAALLKRLATREKAKNVQQQ